MIASLLLLALGIAALVAIANAARPSVRGLVPLAVSWLAAFFTVELAPHMVVLGALSALPLVALGALSEPAGWVGMSALLVADAFALPLILRARRSAVELEEELSAAGNARQRVPYPRHHVALPFLAWRRREIRRLNGVEYARTGRLALRLDVYLPAERESALRPAIVQVHGGGWVIGSRREQGVPLLGHMAANGCVGFNVDYRLSPRATYPDHLVDVKRAIAWVREHAEDYGVDPAFVAITGGSAGGHLCALAALTADDKSLQPGFEDADVSVAACVPFYGVYDLVDRDAIRLPAFHDIVEQRVFKATRAEDLERFRAASPLYRVHRGAPPFFVIHGDADSLIPAESARRFVERLRAVSEAPVLYAEMKGGQHAFDAIPSWRTIPVIEAIERFLLDVVPRRAKREAASSAAR